MLNIKSDQYVIEKIIKDFKTNKDFHHDLDKAYLEATQKISKETGIDEKELKPIEELLKARALYRRACYNVINDMFKPQQMSLPSGLLYYFDKDGYNEEK